MPEWFVVLPTMGAALLVSLILTYLTVRLAHQRKWFDAPNHRKIHSGQIPRLGGVAMFWSFIVVAIAASAAFSFWNGGADGIFELRYLALFAGLAVVHFLGLFDDFYSLRAPTKLIIQVLAAAIITSGGFLLRSFTLPYVGRASLDLLAYPFTILWLVGIANAVNFIDGMDGLAGGITAFAALTIGIAALIEGKLDAAIVAFALFGSISGFLVFNFPPARIFMGDSGSYFLGFGLASLPFFGIPKTITLSTLIIPLTLLIVPVLDTVAAIVRRVRRGQHPFSPDKEHYHHKLLDLGLSQRKILAITYGFSLYLGIIGITLVVLPRSAKLYLLVIVWVGTLIGYYTLEVLKNRRDAQAEKNDAKSID